MEHQKHHANYALAELELSAASHMSRRLFGDTVHIGHKSASKGADMQLVSLWGSLIASILYKFLKCLF